MLEAREVPKKKPIVVTRLGEKVVFWRDQNGTVCCIYDKCCHRGASLGLGKVVDDHIECPFHGMQYDSSGKVTVIPANGKNTPVAEHYKVNSFIVREAYGFIWLWWGDQHIEVPELKFFEELKQGFAYATFSDHWNVHYTRAIENQLDVVHVPFVHKTTIGIGHRTLVHGPGVRRTKNQLRIFVHNTTDDGHTIPLKPSEIQIDEHQGFNELQFRFPNIWQNVISDKVRVFAGFVPVDEENSVIYIRYYHKITNLPIIKHFINLIGLITSKIILAQDKRVVLTQIPKKTSLKMGENLIPGDTPIVEFRKYREELLALNPSKPK